jgi:hypothetical protein
VANKSAWWIRYSRSAARMAPDAGRAADPDHEPTGLHLPFVHGW